MTREEAKSKASIRIQLFDAKGANKVIDQIFNDHEAQLKAKDEEIYWAKVLTLKELCKEVDIDDLLKALRYGQIENISEYFKLIKEQQ